MTSTRRKRKRDVAAAEAGDGGAQRDSKDVRGGVTDGGGAGARSEGKRQRMRAGKGSSSSVEAAALAAERDHKRVLPGRGKGTAARGGSGASSSSASAAAASAIGEVNADALMAVPPVGLELPASPSLLTDASFSSSVVSNVGNASGSHGAAGGGNGEVAGEAGEAGAAAAAAASSSSSSASAVAGQALNGMPMFQQPPQLAYGKCGCFMGFWESFSVLGCLLRALGEAAWVAHAEPASSSRQKFDPSLGETELTLFLCVRA